MKLHVDATKCDGYGTCAGIAPKLFELDEWGFAVVVPDDIPEDQVDLARESVAACPRVAITITGGTE
ncbi:ferredoxin [Mycobacterium sp. 94-17]|uniref:ferredoxin n=1 Tax=Mycobacterium sp. 94-17 TaxID=2986147 RepID=UPI002D1F740A|nr:ferredoxin [Mycobacterium sp. 94-17]MEB4209716.1 ferredoxin [Mycobacterium sp. 94-17]